MRDFKQMSGCRKVRARCEGLTLVEMAMSIAIFVALSVAVSMTLGRGIEHRRDSFRVYRGLNSLRCLVADIQDSANYPNDGTLNVGVAEVYDRYHAKSFAVNDLNSGQIAVSIFANEASVPADFGGPQDLNFDGDASDDLGNASKGQDLQLIPVLLTLTYVDDRGATRTQTLRRLVTKTTD